MASRWTVLISPGLSALSTPGSEIQHPILSPSEARLTFGKVLGKTVPAHGTHVDNDSHRVRRAVTRGLGRRKRRDILTAFNLVVVLGTGLQAVNRHVVRVQIRRGVRRRVLGMRLLVQLVRRRSIVHGRLLLLVERRPRDSHASSAVEGQARLRDTAQSVLLSGRTIRVARRVVVLVGGCGGRQGRESGEKDRRAKHRRR